MLDAIRNTLELALDLQLAHLVEIEVVNDVHVIYVCV